MPRKAGVYICTGCSIGESVDCDSAVDCRHSRVQGRRLPRASVFVR